MSSARGLRLLKSMETLRKKFPDIYDCSTILNKVNIISMSQGCSKSSFTVDISMCNGGGTLHGGYIASVVDVLSFYSILSHSNGKNSWTTNLNVDFLKSAPVGQKVIVETKLKTNGDTSITETSLFDESGTILAKGTATFKAGNEKLQMMVNKRIGFNVYEN